MFGFVRIKKKLQQKTLKHLTGFHKHNQLAHMFPVYMLGKAKTGTLKWNIFATMSDHGFMDFFFI